MKPGKGAIPTEKFEVYEITKNGMPGILAVNAALRNFNHKAVFAWHLVSGIDLKEVLGNGLPSPEENIILSAFADELDAVVKGPIQSAPNALMLAQLTWNGFLQVVWRVLDPVPAQLGLQRVVDAVKFPREFSFEMKFDAEWKYADWMLRPQDVSGSQN